MTRLTLTLLVASFSIPVLSALFFSCNEEHRNKYFACNEALYAVCNGNGSGNYCTVGFKWGSNNPFSSAGLEKPGPASGQIKISYAFVSEGYTFSTHSQDNLVSLSFETTVECSKQRIRDAMAEWESVVSIEFVEQPDYTQADIKIILADISVGGLGFPSFSDVPCKDLAGLMIFKPKSNCDAYYYSALHEAGHVLGLGHVGSNNVMNPDKRYDKLQAGDIEGGQSIYGVK